MKRRQFLVNLSAAGLVPALPGGVALGGPAVPEAVYAKAVHYTRLWGTAVPEMYTSALGLSLDQAEGLFRRLVSDNIIAAPNASGFAKALSPMFDAAAFARQAAEKVTSGQGERTTQVLKEHVEAALDHGGSQAHSVDDGAGNAVIDGALPKPDQTQTSAQSPPAPDDTPDSL